MKAPLFLGAIAILALTVLLWPDSDDGPDEMIGPGTRVAEKPNTGDDPTLASVDASPAANEDEPDAGAITRSTERVAVDVQPEPTPAAEPPQPEPLQGYVVDAAGRPMADIELFYSSDPVDTLQFRATRETNHMPFASRPGFHMNATVRTDQHGEFLFHGPDRRAGGSIWFSHPQYLEGDVATPVDAESDWQALQALPTPHQDSTWTFWIHRSTVVEPVEIEDVILEHLGGSFDFPRRYPLPHERTIETDPKATKIVQSGLPPGKWRFTFIASHGLHQRVEIEVKKPKTDLVSGVIVESWPGAVATDLTIEPEADGSAPWIDASSGMDEWLPKARLRIGEQVRDRHFAQSIRIGHGPVKAAELTLTITSTSGMCTNDAIYLEHLGSWKFAWNSPIKALVGDWRGGMTRTLRLDLARLTDQAGNAVDLRPYLEDGLLDVVIQDDTAIDSMSIRIVR
jgi:hypothetical protein